MKLDVLNKTCNVLLLCCVMVLCISCDLISKDKAVTFLEKTEIEVENQDRHFFPVLIGAKFSSSYKITNKGKKPLLIKEIQTSCSCVVVNYPNYSIAPGKNAFIDIEFDSKKNLGYVKAYIDIYANLENKFKKTLTFDLNVVTSSNEVKDYEERYLKYLKDNNLKIMDSSLKATSKQKGFYTIGF